MSLVETVKNAGIVGAGLENGIALIIDKVDGNVAERIALRVGHLSGEAHAGLHLPIGNILLVRLIEHVGPEGPLREIVYFAGREFAC